MKRNYYIVSILAIIYSFNLYNIFAQPNTVEVVGNVTKYNSITAAYAALPNPITGPVIIQLLSGYSGANETWPISLGVKNGASSTNTITIRPAVTGLTISNSNTSGTVKLFGCIYVIIDGRVNGTGSAKDLVISNTSTLGSAILFANNTTNCTVKYCTISGVTATANNTPGNGVINFGAGSTPLGNSNNTISYCDIKDGSSVPQVLIFGKGAAYYNTNNIITNCNLYNFFSAVYNSYGIYLDTYDSSWTISDNNFYQTIPMTATSGSTQYVIYIKSGSTGSYTISGNYIGGTAAGCGGSPWNVRGSYANIFNAIYINITGYGYNSIQGNTIGNFNWTTTSTASTVPGIWCGINIVNGNANIGTSTGNTIGNTSGSGSVAITTSGSGATSYGICCIAPVYTYNISKNNVCSITASGTSASITHNFAGIYSQTAGSAVISKNFIHNIGLSTSNIASTLSGIYLDGGTTDVQNNMVSLGYDPAGNSITGGYKIYGLYETNINSTNTYYFNSIYIGGTSVVSSQATAAFTSGFATNSILKDNIFCNSRSNSSGSASNYCINLTSGSQITIPNITSNYNLFYFNGSGGKMGYYGGNIINLDNWRYVTHQDYNSGSGNPNFTAPNSSNSSIDMHVQGTTPVEGSGINIASVTDDYDGQLRTGLTPVDIGADAGDFTAVDNFPPMILYTLIPNTSSTSNLVLSNFAVIYDNTGVSTGANLPRIYYKRSSDADAFAGNTSADNGWKYSSAANSSSPFSFVIDYSILYGGGTPSNGTVIQYFIVAQDDANNLSSVPYGATSGANPPVQNINGKSTTPASYMITSALSGTINVGTGNTFTSITNAGGLFSAINNGVLSGNLTVNITSNITESGTNTLNQFSEEGTGGYTVTIQSDGTLRTISGTSTVSMIKINGADRVIIDGGNSKLLTFRNTNATVSQTAATIEITNDSKDCIIRNCTIENNSASSSKGSVLIGNSGSDTNEVAIDNCILRDATAGTTGNPYNCVYSNFSRNKITISNCNIFNFSNNGVYLLSIADSCTISGNSFYYNNPTPSSSDQTSIYIQSGNNHYIYGNYIGGQAPNCGGSAWINNSTGSNSGIVIQAGSKLIPTSIQNNLIQNILLTGASGTFSGISCFNTGGSLNIGTSAGNTINLISMTGGTSTYFSGIFVNVTTATSNVENNTVSNITLTNTGAVTQGMRGISVAGCNVRKNRIFKLSASTSGTLFIAGIEKTNSSTNNEFSNNQVSLDGGSAPNPALYGFYDNSTAGYSYNFFYNSIVVYGTATTTNSTYAFFRSNNSSVYNIKNNILINDRTTGGTGSHYAIGTLGTANWTSNYNFLCAKDAGKIGNWNSNQKTFSAWQASCGDAYGWSVQSGSSPNLDPENLFSNYMNGNLNVNASNIECWYLNGKGIPVSVGTDFSNNIRSTSVTNGSTDIGSDEFNASSNPPAITVNPVVPGLNSFSFAGRTIATVNFNTATIPSTLTLYYYSGINPPNSSNTYGNSYYNFVPTGTNNGLNYTMVLYFDPREQYNISNLVNLGLSKSIDEGSTWNLIQGTTYTAGPPAYVTAANQTSFSLFSFTQKDNPLPVELQSFTSSISKRNVTLKWVTTMEIDNSGFDVERRYTDSRSWEKISFIKSNGTSASSTSYEYEDKKLASGRYNYRLKQIDYNGNFTYYNLNNTVEIGVPGNYSMSQNYPNPFNPVTKIDYDIPENSRVKITLYDITGSEVKVLIDENKEAGYYTLQFNSSGLASGIYLYRLTAANYMSVKKMIIIK